MKQLLVLNGSPHSDRTTAKALKEYANHLQEKYNLEAYCLIDIDSSMLGCQDCGSCQKYCRIDHPDNFHEIVTVMQESDYVLFGTPVYLDMPTGQMVNLLTRLNCMAEPTNREFFKNKKAFFLASALCSGTKSAIHTMMGACEMLGFSIEGRSSREYIKLWRDKKIRGGYRGEEIFLPE